MSLTNDNRTDAERRYDAERDGTLYFKPAAEPPRTILQAAARLYDQLSDEDKIIAILEEIEGPENAPRVVGQIEGADVVAQFDDGGFIGLDTKWRDQLISTDGRSFLAFTVLDDAECQGDIRPDAWPVIKALVAAGVIDQAIDMAQRVERGEL